MYVGQVSVVILNEQAFSQILHIQTVQRSLRVQILRVLPKDKLRLVGHSTSHVAVREVANFGGG